MKNLFIILFITTTLIQTSFAAPYNVPSPVDKVNMNSFSGLWYEIARTYNSFEEDCVAASIEYKQINKNSFKVKNRCFEKEIGAKLIEYNGVAEALEDENFSTLQKTYFWFFSKNYKIIYLKDDYSTAIMTDKEIENLWIMHRKPFMKKKELNALVDYLKEYMDTSRLIFTVQDEKGRYK